MNEDFELPDATAGLDFLQSLKLDSDFGAEPAPAPRAAGPGQARNAHVQKLNAEVMRQTWRKESGMPLSVDEEEGVAGPDDIIDDMYDRQVTQALRALKDAPGDVPGSTETSTPAAPKEEEDPQASFGLADIEDGGKDDESEPTTSRPSLPVTRSRLPSSYWANPEEAAEKTLNEKIGDAIGDALADLARKKGLKSLSDSKWADKSEASSSKKPSRKAPATASEAPASPGTLDQFGAVATPQSPADSPAGPRNWSPAAGVGSSTWSSCADFSSQERRGGGRAPRGGLATPTPALRPAPGPISSPVTAASQSFQRFQNRLTAPTTPAPAPSRNPRSPNTAASSSFQRLQERLARDAANK